jgi:hypothetical protein
MKQEEIIAKAWKDPNFKKKLLENPKEALKECGIKVPENVKIKVIENSEQNYTFVIPQSPANAAQLSEQELEKISASRGCPGPVSFIKPD